MAEAKSATVAATGSTQTGSPTFELLVAVFEADSVAMENCGEHDWDVACAYKRAAGVMAKAAKNLPRSEVEERVKALIDGDGYGIRAELASEFPEDHK